MVYKIIVGHDGMHAPDVALDVREHFRVKHLLPIVGELYDICVAKGFGCGECIVILEMNQCKYNEPNIHTRLDLNEYGEEGRARYLDTFHVAQFNPLEVRNSRLRGGR